MTMKQKGDRRKDCEALDEMVDTLLAEGYSVFSPSQSILPVVTAYKIAVGSKPEDTDDIDFSAHVDWLTENVILKVYSTYRKAGAAVAVLQNEAHEKTPSALLEHITDLWSQLAAVFADQTKLIHLQAEKKAMDAMWSKVRTDKEARQLHEKHRAMIGAPSDLSNRA